MAAAAPPGPDPLPLLALPLALPPAVATPDAGADAGGYLAAWGLWPDADERLIRELSLAEHLEEYQEVGGFDLLDALKRSPEFGPSRP